jgi:hypothetical protein
MGNASAHLQDGQYFSSEGARQGLSPPPAYCMVNISVHATLGTVSARRIRTMFQSMQHWALFQPGESGPCFSPCNVGHCFSPKNQHYVSVHAALGIVSARRVRTMFQSMQCWALLQPEESGPCFSPCSAGHFFSPKSQDHVSVHATLGIVSARRMRTMFQSRQRWALFQPEESEPRLGPYNTGHCFSPKNQDQDSVHAALGIVSTRKIRTMFQSMQHWALFQPEESGQCFGPCNTGHCFSPKNQDHVAVHARPGIVSARRIKTMFQSMQCWALLQPEGSGPCFGPCNTGHCFSPKNQHHVSVHAVLGIVSARTIRTTRQSMQRWALFQPEESGPCFSPCETGHCFSPKRQEHDQSMRASFRPEGPGPYFCPCSAGHCFSPKNQDHVSVQATLGIVSARRIRTTSRSRQHWALFQPEESGPSFSPCSAGYCFDPKNQDHVSVHATLGSVAARRIKTMFQSMQHWALLQPEKSGPCFSPCNTGHCFSPKKQDHVPVHALLGIVAARRIRTMFRTMQHWALFQPEESGPCFSPCGAGHCFSPNDQDHASVHTALGIVSARRVRPMFQSGERALFQPEASGPCSVHAGIISARRARSVFLSMQCWALLQPKNQDQVSVHAALGIVSTRKIRTMFQSMEHWALFQPEESGQCFSPCITGHCFSPKNQDHVSVHAMLGMCFSPTRMFQPIPKLPYDDAGHKYMPMLPKTIIKYKWGGGIMQSHKYEPML